jgi:hypothetical protein
MPSVSEWQTFYAVEAGASATLMGLVFVAVSLNLSRIMAGGGLPGRAAESLAQFFQVFLAATMSLVPRQPPAFLGSEILIFGLLCWAVQTKAQMRYAKARGSDPAWWLWLRVILSQLATVPFFVAGILLILGDASGLYWMVPGFVFSFSAALLSAWVLLVEILR